VTLLPVGQVPHTKSTLGSGSCHLSINLDEDAGRVIVMSALDNIGKGAAAQAVQVLNLVLGLPETTGIDVDGIWA
jgi:N-acetyl-gamma-glutamyl-phosphate reductase